MLVAGDDDVRCCLPLKGKRVVWPRHKTKLQRDMHGGDCDLAAHYPLPIMHTHQHLAPGTRGTLSPPAPSPSPLLHVSAGVRAAAM